MIKMQTIDYLIKYLLDENPDIKIRKQPENFQEKFTIYRSLTNIRQAKPITQEYIQQEDKLLQEVLEKTKKTTSINEIDTLSTTHPECNIENKNKIALWQGDITTLQVGAIVNAANSQGLGCFVPCHNCIDNQINTYAGIRLRQECDKHMKTINYNLPTGEAFTTKAYNLPAQHVIHTVGPIITSTVTEKQQQQLANCYTNVLNQAKQNNIKTVAFCSISTGEFRFPKDTASRIAIRTVDQFLGQEDSFEKIIFNVYSDDDKNVYEKTIRTYRRN